jgi:exonuclease III
VYANACGLKHNFSDILNAVRSLTPAVLCLSETHVTEDTLDSEIEISGYRTEFSTSISAHTGGTSIYIREDIKYEPIVSVCDDMNWWLCGVKIKTDKGLIQIVAVYRSPSCSIKTFLDFFEKWLDENDNECNKTIIVGDFNINLLSKGAACRRTKDIIYSRGYRQLVNFNTRVAQTSASLIDYVLSNSPKVTVKRQKKFKIGDHETIKIECELFNLCNDTRPRVISIRDWKNLDYAALNELLVRKLNLTDEMSVCEKAEHLDDELNSAVSFLLPHKVIYLTGKKQNQQPWYTSEMHEQRKRKNAAHERVYHATALDDEERKKLSELYRTERNLYTKLLDQGEKNYYFREIDCVKKDSKKMWHTLKDFVGDSSKKGNAVEINPSFENDITTDSIENKLNLFFVESVGTIVESIPDASLNEIELIEKLPQLESNFTFKPIEINELVNIVKNLQETAVPDNVNLTVLLNVFDTIQNDLLDIINSAILKGCFPRGWRKSMVIPLPKVKNSKLPQDLRPINILPLFEKIFEIVLQKQIMAYVDKYSILYDMQSGFREKHSCESAIQFILNSWRNSAEEGKITIAVFLDFKRAFETIDRSLLLEKLKKYGFSENSVRLLDSYLSERRQFVFANGKKSDEKFVELGVPQGSVLGPLLFILYINDLPRHLKDVLIKIFADDTLLSVSDVSYESAANTMNNVLKSVVAWLKINKVKLNTSKTKYMVIAKSKKKLTSLSEEIKRYEILIENECIERVNVIKYLGVMIDCCLKFDEHVSYVLKKAGKKIMYLGRIRNKLSLSTKKLVYNCIVAPHFDYCATVLWKTSEENMAKMQKLQNKAMRFILNCRKSASVRFMLRKIGWLDMKQKLELNVLVMIKKILTGNLPEYLSQSVQYVSNVHNYNTRSSRNIYVPTASSAFSEKSLNYSGFQLYNNLPECLKNEMNLNKFKNNCVKYLKETSTVPYNK